MCGIIGLFGNMTLEQARKKDFIHEGLILDAVRGQDSTGIALLPTKAKEHPIVYRRAVNGSDFVQMKRTRRLIEDLPSHSGIIGHNRLATKGNIHDTTAHPFSHQHITLVHNGTVYNHTSLCSDNPKWSSSTVDSENVCRAIAIDGADKVLPKINGPYSFVWYDQEKGTLNFARNREKPMWWIWSKDRKTLFYGSEVEMLWLLTKRNGIEIEGDVQFTSPMHHYSFSDPFDLSKVEKTPFQPASPTQVVHIGQAPLGRVEASTITTTQNTGSKPTFETISACVASAVIGTAKNEERVRLFNELAQKHNIPVGVNVVVKATSWAPYQSNSVGRVSCCTPDTLGWISAKYGDTHIQVFNTKLSDWTSLTPGNREVSVMIDNFRLNKWEQYKQAVFVATFRREAPIVDADIPALIETDETEVKIGTKYRRKVSLREFKELTKNGCANCADPIHPKDADLMEWFGPQEDWPLCLSCSENPSVKSQLAYVISQ